MSRVRATDWDTPGAPQRASEGLLGGGLGGQFCEHVPREGADSPDFPNFLKTEQRPLRPWGSS
eukprot:8797324-Pyramimonas_sp.AAC.1